jgi:predicted RNase H-like HicB family nuclease
MTFSVYNYTMKSQDVIKALKSDGWEQLKRVATFSSSIQPKGAALRSHIRRKTFRSERSGASKASISKAQMIADRSLRPAPEWEKYRMRHYIALIHKDADSDYGVSFPDLPGVVSAGSNLDEARKMATEALAFHLEGMAQDGEAVPEPSSLEEVMATAANKDGVAVLIEAPAAEVKSVRINITMPADVLDQIDKYAEREGFTRSGFLAQAAKKAMAA